MAMLLGKKVGMTQVFDEAGRLLPVTVIQAGPCSIIQIKTTENDGYNAVQLGYDDVKPSRRKKASTGHSKKAGIEPKRFVREMRLGDKEQAGFKPGEALTVSVFSKEAFVDVKGVSKGKGFQGVMKRYKFAGMPNSHGTERKHRSPGSIASYGTDRGHGGDIKKGKRMAGHMGNRRITSKNHKVVSIDEQNHLLVVKGAVPGPAGGYVVVRSAKRG